MTEYRIMEEDGYFFVQEKIYEQYDFISRFTRWIFMMPMNEFSWSIVYLKGSKTLEGARDNVKKLKATIKTEPEYHQA
jgi:hypothetical protein